VQTLDDELKAALLENGKIRQELAMQQAGLAAHSQRAQVSTDINSTIQSVCAYYVYSTGVYCHCCFTSVWSARAMASTAVIHATLLSLHTSRQYVY
jgi:hypothetical protein